MNSAPAVLRMPRIEIDSIKCEPSSEEELPNKSYPWAACTPEPSPRYWGGAPDVPVKPTLSVELLRMVCEPCLEQISCIAQQAQVDANVSPQLLRSMCEPSFEQVISVLQQMTMASNELLRSVCEPFFQQMITALQQTLLQNCSQAHFNDQCQSMHIMGQSANGMCCYQPVFYTHHVDEVSTDADDSPTSLFSGPSSEGEGVDAINKAEDSESQSDVERSIMVCRHWKSKGWCRLESSVSSSILSTNVASLLQKLSVVTETLQSSTPTAQRTGCQQHQLSDAGRGQTGLDAPGINLSVHEEAVLVADKNSHPSRV